MDALPAQAASSFVPVPDVGGMSATDPVLVSYGKAVQAMQALPDANPLSWAYQVAIHGTTLSGSKTAWDTCQHGNYFFWSWHPHVPLLVRTDHPQDGRRPVLDLALLELYFGGRADPPAAVSRRYKPALYV